MRINKKAVLYAKKEAIINAPIKKVWELQSDIQNWSKWQDDISFVKLNGQLQKGTTFDWKAMGMSIHSELQVVEREKEIGWTGRSMGMNAEHAWYFEKKDGKTKVITEESLSGWFPKVLKIFMPNFLTKSLTNSLATLKSAAEK